jgi:hypothetical protein
MPNITLNLSVAQIQAVAPAALRPVIGAAAEALNAWAPAQLNGWYQLALVNQTPARAQLLQAMTDAAVTALGDADGAQFDKDVDDNAASVASQKNLIDRAWQAILIVAAGLVTVAL